MTDPILTSDMPQARGLAVRLYYLMTHHRKPLNWTEKGLEDAQKNLNRIYRALAKAYPDYRIPPEDAAVPDQKVLDAMLDDMNTPAAVARVLEMVKDVNKGGDAKPLVGSLALLGLLRGAAG